MNNFRINVEYCSTIMRIGSARWHNDARRNGRAKGRMNGLANPCQQCG